MQAARGRVGWETKGWEFSQCKVGERSCRNGWGGRKKGRGLGTGFQARRVYFDLTRSENMPFIDIFGGWWSRA